MENNQVGKPFPWATAMIAAALVIVTYTFDPPHVAARSRTWGALKGLYR